MLQFLTSCNSKLFSLSLVFVVVVLILLAINRTGYFQHKNTRNELILKQIQDQIKERKIANLDVNRYRDEEERYRLQVLRQIQEQIDSAVANVNDGTAKTSLSAQEITTQKRVERGNRNCSCCENDDYDDDDELCPRRSLAASTDRQKYHTD